jgi:hypothetical protein
MQVVRHDDEVVELEPTRANAGTKDFDEKRGVALGPEKMAASMRFGGHEEGAAGFDDVVGIGVAVRFGHGTQGLKPKFILRLYGTTVSRALTRGTDRGEG